jgi:ribosome assembly protein 3
MPPKRARKRKRRRVSLSSSSSSSTSHPGTADVAKPVQKIALPSLGGGARSPPTGETYNCSSSSLSSSEDDVERGVASPECKDLPESRHLATTLSHPTREWSRSPSPSLCSVPSGLSRASRQAVNHGGQASQEWTKDLRVRFQRYWMASIADAFEADLDKLRQVRPFIYELLV